MLERIKAMWSSMSRRAKVASAAAGTLAGGSALGFMAAVVPTAVGVSLAAIGLALVIGLLYWQLMDDFDGDGR